MATASEATGYQLTESSDLTSKLQLVVNQYNRLFYEIININSHKLSQKTN